MNPAAIPLSPPGDQVLTALCEEIVAHEEANLHALLTVVRELRRLAASGKTEALANVARLAGDANAALADIQRNRQHFRQEAARILKAKPATLTLRVVAEHLPPAQAASVAAGRQRLLGLARELEQVNRGTALVVWWSLDFVRQVFARLLGRPLRGRYSARGTIQAAVCGPTWQARG